MVSSMRRPERVLPIKWKYLPEDGTWHLVLYLLALPQPHLIDVYYLSHAFPRQMNHQQRKPTRPPTTTTAATEMPAIAPVERLGPLLLAATHVEEPALGVKPSLHVQTLFVSGDALAGQSLTHDFLLRPKMVLSGPGHFLHTRSSADFSHVAQSFRPPSAHFLHSLPLVGSTVSSA